MMSNRRLLVYAITDKPLITKQLGLWRNPMECIPTATYYMVVSSISEEQLTRVLNASRQELGDLATDFQDLVKGISNDQPAIPVRFPTVFTLTEKVIKKLSESAQRISECFKNYAETCEVSTYAKFSGGNENNSLPKKLTSGIESESKSYLVGKFRLFQEKERVKGVVSTYINHIREISSFKIIDIKTNTVKDTNHWGVHFLIAHANAAELINNITNVAQTEGNDIFISGPWPPFQFVPNIIKDVLTTK